MEEQTSKARVVYVCKSCEQKSYWKDEIAHKEDCKKKDPKRTCSESGKKPHDK